MMKILNKAIMILSVGLIAAQGIFSQIPGYIYGPDIDNWTPAIKDQQRENGKEFLRLLKEAKDKGLREINLKRGDYRFSTSFSEDPSKGMIVLKGYKNLMINGNGSQFWFDDSNTAISLESCENVNIRNLLIDYDPLPMTQGIVSAIGEDYLEFRIEEGFKSPVEIRKNINSPGSKSFIYDKDTRIIKRDIPHIVGRDFQDIGNNKVRASYTAYGGEKMNLLPIQAGDYIVIVVASKVAVSVVQSGNITLNNLSLYSSPNFGIYNSYCSGVRIENCNIIPRPGTKRMMSTNVDGMHIANSDIGPRIVNCRFSGMGDDAINVYTLFNERVEKALSAETAILSLNNPMILGKGDTLNFYDSRTLQIRGMVRIVSIKESVVKEVTHPEGRAGGKKNYDVRFDRKITLQPGDIVENLRRVSTGTYIANNRIYNTTTRGIIMKAKNSIIENNYLEDVANSGILTFANLGDFFEGPFPENNIIRNNTLLRVGHAGGTRNAGYKKLGAICLFVEYQGPMKKEMFNARNITVENNFIDDTPLPGIFVFHVSEATLRANTIMNYSNGSKGRMGEVQGIKPFSAIYIGDSRNISLHDNLISRPGINAEEEIRYGPNFIPVKNNH